MGRSFTINCLVLEMMLRVTASLPSTLSFCLFPFVPEPFHSTKPPNDSNP